MSSLSDLMSSWSSSTPRDAIAAAMDTFAQNATILVPGSCDPIPPEACRVIGALSMHAFRLCPHYRSVICAASECMAPLLGEAMWSMGCHSVTSRYHVPAVVRGVCFAVCRMLAADLSIPLPGLAHYGLPRFDEIIQSRMTEMEVVLIEFFRANISPSKNRWDAATSSALHKSVAHQLVMCSSVDCPLPCAVSDAIEEAYLLPGLNSVGSRDFSLVLRKLLGKSECTFIPSRLIERLIRVEIAPFEEVLRHLPRLVSYLQLQLPNSELDGYTPTTCKYLELLPCVRAFLVDILHVLPSVSTKDFIAYCELAQRAPRCLSAMLPEGAPDENTFTSELLHWVTTESPYKRELDEIVETEDNPQLLYWPSSLLRMLTASGAKDSLAIRGWKPFLDVAAEIRFRRTALDALCDVLKGVESLDIALREFSAESIDLNHLSEDGERLIDAALSHRFTNPSDEERKREEDACDQFVEALLGHDSSVGKLYTQVQESRGTLKDVESVLVTFQDRISSVRNEIGSLREQSSRRAIMLENSTAVEKVVSEVVTHLIVPPDVVHVVSNAETSIELGPQFRHALKILYGILQDRCGCTPNNAGSVSSSGRAVRIVLPDTLAFTELLGVTEDLVVLACSRIKAAFEDKIAVLRKPRTNIAVQQEHIIGPLHPFVRFMRVVIPLLRRSASLRRNQSEHQSACLHPTPPTFNYHFNVVRRMYSETRQLYVETMRRTYFQNISRYLMQLKKLEDGSLGSQGWSLFSARKAAFTLPPLTESGARVSPGDFGMGRRQQILENLLSHPVVPVVATSRGHQLMYEETFRSINVMLCDVVTREFLFSFDFFGGDDTIYADVFQPVVQYIVDYVAEMLLQVSALVESETRRDRTLSHSRFGNVTFSCSNTDAVGLLSLIRMCHIFRTHMRRVRRIECLNGYYDSLLELLWPAFKRALSIQLDCMRSLTAQGAMKLLASLRSSTERLAAVHPISLRFAEFTAAVISLAVPMKVDADADCYASLGPVAEDGADSVDQLIALRANLSILRIEFLRIIGTVTSELVREGSSIARALSSASMVNNLYHVVTIWALTPPLVVSFERDGQVMERMVPAQSVAQSPDFVALNEQLHVARTQLVEQLLSLVFPWLIAVVRQSCSVEDAFAGAKQFAESWQDGFAEAHRYISTVLAHPKNQQETLPQFCMQLLLYNTRAHAYLAQMVDNTALKSMLVTNHQLIQFMGSFAHVQIDEPME